MPFQLQIVAVPEDLADGKKWSFYLINDSELEIQRAILERLEFEWGNNSVTSCPNSEVKHVPSQGHSLLWRDNDPEMRIWMDFSVECGESVDRYQVKFPILHTRREELTLIPGLNKSGWSEDAFPAK